jgi:membrane glycosyltransferase
VILSGLFELWLGSLLAPLLMIHHTRIVISIVTGGSVRWGAQRRRASSGMFIQLVRGEVFSTVLGLGAAAALAVFAPHLLLWLAPIWAPLALAIPLVLLVSTSTVGELLQRTGVLAVPSEVEPDELLLRANELQALTKADEAARFRDLVLDPLLLTAQLKKLRAAQATHDNVTPIANPDLPRLMKRALRVGPAALSELERTALSQDEACLRTLHREAWRSWPVESWQLARDVPQLPQENA